MHDDAVRWNDRYQAAAPASPLAPEPLGDRPDLSALVPASGTAVDIACGLGAQTLWLAARGLQVTALDVSPVALDRLRNAARAAGLQDRIDAQVTDLDAGLPEHLSLADVVICQRFRHPALYPSIIALLAPGGIALVTVLSAVGVHGQPGPFHAPAGELSTAFNELEMLYAAEADGTAAVVGRKRPA